MRFEKMEDDGRHPRCWAAITTRGNIVSRIPIDSPEDIVKKWQAGYIRHSSEIEKND